MRWLIAVVCWIVLFNVATLADELQPGNLLVCGNNSICEYTVNGKKIQSFLIPSSNDQKRGKRREPANDCAVDHNGRIHVFNGNFNPTLSSLDPKTGLWEHHKISGWSAIANERYSGLDVFGDYVFLTDMRTHPIAKRPQGVIRFDLSDFSSRRFAAEHEPIDVTIGFDGYLYVLHTAGSPSGQYVEVYAPSSLKHVRTIQFKPYGESKWGPSSDSHHAIAVDREGNLFIADWHRGARKFDADGNLLEVIDESKSIYDIDVDETGRVAFCSVDRGTMIYTAGTLQSISTPIFEKGLRFVRPPVDVMVVDPTEPDAKPTETWFPEVTIVEVLLAGFLIAFFVFWCRELRRG